jgi:hypothetical protein
MISAPLILPKDESVLARMGTLIDASGMDMAGNVPESGQRKPEEENKLKRVVEREPVDHSDKALNNAEK